MYEESEARRACSFVALDFAMGESGCFGRDVGRRCQLPLSSRRWDPKRWPTDMPLAQSTQDGIQETADRLRPSRAGETVAMKAEAGSSYTASSAGLSSPRHLGRLREGERSPLRLRRRRGRPKECVSEKVGTPSKRREGDERRRRKREAEREPGLARSLTSDIERQSFGMPTYSSSPFPAGARLEWFS